MKFLFAIFSFFTLPLICNAQWKTSDPVQFQKKLDYWYKSKEYSPFKDYSLRAKIEGVNYFKIKAGVKNGIIRLETNH